MDPQTENTLKIAFDGITAIATAAAAIYAARSAIAANKAMTQMEQHHRQMIDLTKTFHKESLENELGAQVQTLQSECLQKYLLIMNRITESIAADKMEYAYDGIRGLIDLLWFEFHMWKASYKIPTEVFQSWLLLRRRDYISGDPQMTFKTTPNQMSSYQAKCGSVVSYRNVWNDLIEKRYYKEGDEFVKLMNAVHHETPTLETVLESAYNNKL